MKEYQRLKLLASIASLLVTLVFLAVMAFFRPSWAGRASMRVPLANVAVETDAVLALTVNV